MLKRILTFSAVAFLAAVGIARADAVDDQVTAAYAAWNEAFNKGDPAAIAAFYADDAKFLPPDHVVYDGPAGVQKFFTGLLGNGVNSHGLELIESDASGDLIVAVAKWSAKGKDASGADAAFGGIATHVFEKQADGSYKLIYHTFN